MARDAEFRRELPGIKLGSGTRKDSNMEDLIGNNEKKALTSTPHRESRDPVAEMADWGEAYEYRYGA